MNFKDGNEVMHVKFESYQGETEEQKQSDYFDITEFYNEIENGKLKNIPSKAEGNIFLRGERTYQTDGFWDITPYPKVDELLSLIKNEKLKDKITVGKVKIVGNIKNLLPYLVIDKVTQQRAIKEINEGITFTDYSETLCYGEIKTEYDGENNSVSPDQIQEYYNRVDNRAMRIINTTIKTLNSENYKGDFIGDMLTNVNFIDSDLSKISFYSCSTSNGYLKFENTILPTNMSGSAINKIILKNVTFPREEFNSNPEYDFTDLPYNVPDIKDSLEIYGEIKNSILKDATPEQLDSLVPQENMPPKYKGSEEIYNRLKKIFRGEAQNKDFGNYQGSIQKQQSQLLALLQTQSKSRG